MHLSERSFSDMYLPEVPSTTNLSVQWLRGPFQAHWYLFYTLQNCLKLH